MSISHLLEDFAAYTEGNRIDLTDVLLEEQRLESFENGYQAGWEDAVKAQSEDSRKVSADLAQSLTDLSFSYHEARSALTESLAPLLRQMVQSVLPRLARQSLPERVAEEVEAVMAGQGDHSVVIRAAPSEATAIEEALPSEGAMRVTVEPDEAMTEGQVHMKLGATEREIDLPAVLEGLERSVSDFFDDNHKETA